MNKRYNDLNTYLRKHFGGRVQKISIDAGFSCPNRDGKISTGGCIYCNSKGSGTGAYSKGISIRDQLISSKGRLARRYKAKKFIAYFQSFSNTYAPVEKLKAIYEEALSVDDVVGLSIGTRPDNVDKPVLDLLQGYCRDYMIWIEYGLQSVHDFTLMLINRGHDFKCFKRAVDLTRNRGIKICAHVILGLPNENREHMLETARVLADMDIDGLKLHLLYVIKGTELENLYRLGKYRCLEQKEYTELVCDFLELLPRSMVIQRLTGDPHPEELVSPMWALKKNENLLLINSTLVERNSYQGKFAAK
ncbi:MAG: TIGR01212 family radical SAM protein [Desulfobacterales bacterium]|nr:TIGR01212 family radical SAM protein [Desulfobacteraceae bacterium]MBT4363169.1 TIGR01212 family radical SAM protein [Desulfobacteraceae bacterium]MBT7084638.1 TIGR01212 family radical SAM protein [Desulfobacterales bacterium]